MGDVRNKIAKPERDEPALWALTFVMTTHDTLSASELGSLREVAKGVRHGPIPEADALRLLELRLIYRLLGDLRMTTAGRLRAFGDF
jgi:hypothetical protein